MSLDNLSDPEKEYYRSLFEYEGYSEKYGGDFEKFVFSEFLNKESIASEIAQVPSSSSKSSIFDTLCQNTVLKQVTDFIKRTNNVEHFLKCCCNPEKDTCNSLYLPAKLSVSDDPTEAKRIISSWFVVPKESSVRLSNPISIDSKLNVFICHPPSVPTKTAQKKTVNASNSFVSRFATCSNCIGNFYRAPLKDGSLAKKQAMEQFQQELSFLGTRMEALKVKDVAIKHWNQELVRRFSASVFSNDFEKFCTIYLAPFLHHYAGIEIDRTHQFGKLITRDIRALKQYTEKTPLDQRDRAKMEELELAVTKKVKRLGKDMEDALAIPVIESKRPENIAKYREMMERTFLEHLKTIVQYSKNTTQLPEKLKTREGLLSFLDEIYYISCKACETAKDGCCNLEEGKCSVLSSANLMDEFKDPESRNEFVKAVEQVIYFLGLPGNFPLSKQLLIEATSLSAGVTNRILVENYILWAGGREDSITGNGNLNAIRIEAYEIADSILNQLQRGAVEAFVLSLRFFIEFELNFIRYPDARVMDFMSKLQASALESALMKVEGFVHNRTKGQIKNRTVGYINNLREYDFKRYRVESETQEIAEAIIKRVDRSQAEALLLLHYCMLIHASNQGAPTARQTLETVWAEMRNSVIGIAPEKPTRDIAATAPIPVASDLDNDIKKFVAANSSSFTAQCKIASLVLAPGVKITDQYLKKNTMLSDLCSDPDAYVCSCEQMMYPYSKDLMQLEAADDSERKSKLKFTGKTVRCESGLLVKLYDTDTIVTE